MVGTDTNQNETNRMEPILSRKKDWLAKLLELLESVVPAFVKRRLGFFGSFKNRILFTTFVALLGVVVIIGVILQLTVFPHLTGDPTAVLHIKIIHFLASVAVIAMSWFFIEAVSKRITQPLKELTERADQISREAGQNLGSEHNNTLPVLEEENPPYDPSRVDEIFQLTSSFNRMLAHLKASETRLRESEAKYRFLFDNAPSPIFVVDAATLAILDINATAEEEYKYSREELLNMTFAQLAMDSDEDATREALKAVYPTDQTHLPVLRQRRSDGSLRLVNFQASPSRYRGRPAIIVAVWDVTERLEKHAMLIQASKMASLGEMATGIAHELNQPLNVIRLGCDYLAKRTRGGNSVSAEEVANIHKEFTAGVERATRLINHLRQFGRKPEETMCPIDINSPIRKVYMLLGTQLEAHGIRWTLELEENLPKIMGDENRIEQVVINLVLNSRDAIIDHQRNLKKKCKGSSEASAEQTSQVSKEMSLKIRTFSEGGFVFMTVSDTGPGIPPALRTKVFEPFFTTKAPGEGTGLGLSITYTIVREHGGTIHLCSESSGACFKMAFPALSVENELLALAPKDPSNCRPKAYETETEHGEDPHR